MISRFIRDTINLLLYGGIFIGLCAACLTALSFEIIGTVNDHLTFILFVGMSTSALYCAHRVVGLKRVSHIVDSRRFEVIRKYQSHIWAYTGLWCVCCLFLLIQLADLNLMFHLLPGAIIAAGYVLPVLPGKKRLRDLGWGKIILIGWSWGWLTAFLPLYYYSEATLFLSGVHGLERMLFIILITIPFEIRDTDIDRSVGLITMPSKFGKRKTMVSVYILTVLIILMSALISFHYLNFAYFMAMTVICLLTIPIIKNSYSIHDDYYFSGLIDGLMILALFLFLLFEIII